MGGIIHVECLAHVRRHFFEAEKIGGQGKMAGEALRYIRKLYHIEKELRKEKDKLKQWSGIWKARTLRLITTLVKTRYGLLSSEEKIGYSARA